MHAWKLTHFLIQLHRTLCTSAKSILSGCSAAIGSVRCGSNMHCVAAKKIKFMIGGHVPFALEPW